MTANINETINQSANKLLKKATSKLASQATDEVCDTALHYDLHCHSTRSDGTFSPTEVVQKADEAGINVLALTDHDTTEGIEEARTMADKLGIRLINGVEISCEHTLTGGYGKNQSTNKIIHVLALNFSDMEQMSSRLNELQESRANRGRAMVEKLAQLLKKDFRIKDSQLQKADWNSSAVSNSINGSDVNPNILKNGAVDLHADDFAEILWQAVLIKAKGNPQAVGRSHIAKVLLEMGVVASMQQAFNRYIADNKPAYVKIDALTMAETIKLIHDCGGQAVVAHPTRYNLSSTRVRKLITEFAQLGGDASELPSAKEPLSKRRMVDKVIADNGLLVSVGSDFHGTTMPWRKLGDVPKVNSMQRGIWERF